MTLVWIIAGALMFLSIAGIKFGKVCFKIGRYNFFPFGKETIDKNEFYGREEFRIDCRSRTAGQLWFAAAGWWLSAGHFISAILSFLTILGIPSARRHLRLACISINPIGQIIVTEKEAAKAKRANALKRIEILKNELSIRE